MGVKAAESTGRVLEILGEPSDRKRIRNVLDVHGLLLKGLPGTAIDRLSESYGLTNADMGRLFGLTSRTVQGRRKQERLCLTEVDRLWRAAVILDEAAVLLGAREKARDWLCRPLRALGGVCPLEMLRTEPGYAEVRNVLGRIEWGVWS